MRCARRPGSSSVPFNDDAACGKGSGSRTKLIAWTILVVDDFDDNRELFSTILREHGFVVTTATDGLDALAVAAREHPHVILLDLAMPNLDGFDTMERLRLEEHGRAASIVVVSAFNDRLTRTRALELGADAFLAKPCTPAQLLAVVNEAIAKLESPRAAAG
jgi:CheY-like chemotaxis protein